MKKKENKRNREAKHKNHNTESEIKCKIHQTIHAPSNNWTTSEVLTNGTDENKKPTPKKVEIQAKIKWCFDIFHANAK